MQGWVFLSDVLKIKLFLELTCALCHFRKDTDHSTHKNTPKNQIGHMSGTILYS